MTLSFPTGSTDYRVARNQLLQREIELRWLTEEPAQARRALPPGGIVPKDYAFQQAGPGGTPTKVQFAGGWWGLRLLSSAGTTYNRGSFGVDTQGAHRPVLNVFRREGDVICHFWGSELLDAPAGSVQEARHVDPIIPCRGVGKLGSRQTWLPVPWSSWPVSRKAQKERRSWFQALGSRLCRREAGPAEANRRADAWFTMREQSEGFGSRSSS